MKLADVTQLPGYQVIAPDCPQWKRVLIEKKNASLLSEAMVMFQYLVFSIHFHNFQGDLGRIAKSSSLYVIMLF